MGARSIALASVVALLWGVVGTAGSPVRADEPDPPEAPPEEEPGKPAEPGQEAEDPDEPVVPQALDERIKAAVHKGVLWVRSQGGDGWWGPLTSDHEPTYAGTTNSYMEPYGGTALALFTLLKCGVSPDEPLVKKGFQKLRAKKMDGHCYELAAKLLAITATADPFGSKGAARPSLTGELRTWAQDLVATLVKRRAPDGWRYWGAEEDRSSGGVQDLSSTQFVALSLYAAERCGIRVAPAVWEGVLRYALSAQEEAGPEHPRAVIDKAARAKPTTGDGGGASSPEKDHARGFAYMRSSSEGEYTRPTGAMTACGVGCLMMARFSLMTKTPGLWAKQNSANVQKAVYDGLAWLDREWNAKANPGDDDHWVLYYAYCVERTMDLVGGWRLGKHYWYVEMAQHLVATQSAGGSWDTDNGYRKGKLLDTCFALLFLRRATVGAIPFPSVTGGSEEEPVDNRGK